MKKELSGKEKIIRLGIAIAIGLVIGSIAVSFLPKHYESEVTIPAEITEKKDGNDFTTALYGRYVTDSSPSEYATGLEEEVSFSKNGTYESGFDIKPGVYDLYVTNGTGTVSINDNDPMEMSNKDNVSVHYDNLYLGNNDTLAIEGVDIQLKPQTEDGTQIFHSGEYTVSVNTGQGRITSSEGLRLYLGTTESSTFTRKIDYVEIQSGSIITVENVVANFTEINYVEEKTETYEVYSEEDAVPVCKVNGIETECSELQSIDKLERDVQNQIDNDNWSGSNKKREKTDKYHSFFLFFLL